MGSAKETREPGEELMQKVVSLCKRRGFVFQSSEIYGGLKSAYDYGPLGVELKRNLMNEWWRDVVHSRENVMGLESSIIMHPDVWRASGHVAGFSDPLVDCKLSKERFRTDKAGPVEVESDGRLVMHAPDKAMAKLWAEAVKTQHAPGAKVEVRDKDVVLHAKEVTPPAGGQAGKIVLAGFDGGPDVEIPYRGYVTPGFNCPFLSEERTFNLMFRSFLGSVDPLTEVVDAFLANKEKSKPELRALIETTLARSTVYLRPETAQGMFVQFQNCLNSVSMKIPFGIAQMGKAFRNEVTVEHFTFRSCEFEQMEIEFFCEPGTDDRWLEYWKNERMRWWRQYANNPDKFVFRQHAKTELAHYAKDCYDIEYEYPWGFGELEGIANRTDYDLKKHAEASGQHLVYTDSARNDPATGKPPYRFTPYVIEPSGGATRGTLVYLIDAYSEETRKDAKGEPVVRTVLKLHPRLAPIKVGVFPLVKKDGMPEKAREIVEEFFRAGINSRYDEQHAIGRRYARHDEAGTPYCITVDGQTIQDNTVTIRDRDTTAQERIKIEEALSVVQARLARI